MDKPTPKFERPVVQGAFDPHPETTPTAGELRIADNDPSNPEVLRQKKIDAAIDAEPQTPEQLAAGRDQAIQLAQRYDRNRQQPS